MSIGPATRQEIEATFIVIPLKSNSQELVFCCPECNDRTGHRSVNLSTGTTNCFRCGKGQNGRGNFFAWAKALGFTFTSATDVSRVSFADLQVEPEKFYVPPPRPIELPKGFTLIEDEPDSIYAQIIVEMAERKHLTRRDFETARVGFSRLVPRWEAYAIFPVFDTGHVVYYQGRTYVDVPDETTKRFPFRGEIKYGARYWLYNIDALRYTHAPIVIVVESILNVLSLKKRLHQLGRKDVVPVCAFKHHVSRYQFSRIQECRDVKEICFLFDHDAIAETWRMSIPTLGCKLSVAEMPAGPDNTKLDPNDDVDAALIAFEARIPFSMAKVIEKRWQSHHDRVVSNSSGRRIVEIGS